MAISMGKLAIVIGAGLIGSAMSKEGGLSDAKGLISGALKIFTKSLQQDNKRSESISKAPNDTLVAQVNSLRQELQLLASSRSVTIISTGSSGSHTIGATTIIVIGVVGYGYIWWKGWKISDMMFVARCGFSDAVNTVGKQMDSVTSSLASVKRHLSSRIDRVDSNVDECKQLTLETKEEVSGVHGDLSVFHEDVESVRIVVQTLESKLGRIEEKQDFAAKGVYNLCKFVEKLDTRNPELTQGSPSTSRPAIAPPQHVAVARMSSMPPLSIESASPSFSSEPVKVLHTPKIVSTSGFKEFNVSNTIRRTSSSAKPPIEIPSIEESSTANSASNSNGFGWFNGLLRARSTASRSVIVTLYLL